MTSGMKVSAQELYWNFYDGGIQMQEQVNRSFGEVGTQEVQLGILDFEDNFSCVSKKIEVVDLNTVIRKYELIQSIRKKSQRRNKRNSGIRLNY